MTAPNVVIPKILHETKALKASHIAMGSLYLLCLAQAEIPLFPVPVTLHTFAILSLALFAGARCAFFSSGLYLATATAGLPVFPHLYSDPFWWMHPSAGFCMSFPLAAFVAGKIAEKRTGPALFRYIGAAVAGETLIFASGIAWLSWSFGWREAIHVGLMPFLFVESIKVCAAISTKFAYDCGIVRFVQSLRKT